MSGLDYALMVLYMLFLVGMGLYYRRFAQESMENYFLGERKMKGWMSGTSYAVTCMNADVAPAYCGMTVITGTVICWWYLSRFGLALMIGGLLFAACWRRLKIFTSPEFYELRFGGAAAPTMRAWVSMRSAFVAVVAWTGAGLLGLTKVSEALLGWSRFETFLLVIPIILVYVVLSGYMGVVMSDLNWPTVSCWATTCLRVFWDYLIDAGQDAAYVIVLSSIAATCLLWVAVALCTEPEPEEKLLAFYQRGTADGMVGADRAKGGR